MKKVFVLLLMTGLLLTGCSGETTTTEGTTNAAEITIPTTTEAAVAEPVVIQSALGEVTVQPDPQNVVVFDYSALDSLNKMAIAVAGVAKSDLPTYLSKFDSEDYVDIGTLSEPNYEAIAALNPDLILISEEDAQAYDQLSAIAPTVYLPHPGADYFEGYAENLRTLGKIFDKESYVESELESSFGITAQLKQHISEEGFEAMVLTVNGDEIKVFGPDSQYGSIFTAFGFIDAASALETSSDGTVITLDQLLEIDPQYLFYIDFTPEDSDTEMALMDDSVQTLTAYDIKQIGQLGEGYWSEARGGFEATQEMISEMIRVVD